MITGYPLEKPPEQPKVVLDERDNLTRMLSILQDGEPHCTGEFNDLFPSILQPPSVFKRLGDKGYDVRNLTLDGSMAWYEWNINCPMRQGSF